jgi:hypothetical protein
MKVLGDELLPKEKVSYRVSPNKKMDKCCICILKVDECPDTMDLVGAVLTCALPDNHLQPLPYVYLSTFILFALPSQGFLSFGITIEPLLLLRICTLLT